VDRRVRLARLTRAGRAEVALLDRRSDERASSLLAPLSRAQQDRLVAAMGEVERLLAAAQVELAVIDPDHPDGRHCLARYYADIDERFEGGFDLAASLSANPVELRLPAGLLLVATLHGGAIGCGALKFAPDEPGRPTDIKRMWVDPSARGLGLGRRLLAELESLAHEHGSTTVRLETNRALTEAIALYRSAGYVEVEPFNDEPHAHHWFEKRLARSHPRR
jgi:GNAT superfamily N-acetyltransferase